MSLETTERQSYKTQTVFRPTGAATLAVYQQTVIADTTVGAFTLTLPPVGECKGRIYTFRIAAGTAAMTLVFTGDAAGQSNLTSMDAVNDRTTYYSDGFCWLQIASTIA